MKKTVIFSPVPLGLSNSNLQEKFSSVGGNPGNLVFISALKEELNFVNEVDISCQDYQNLDSSVSMVMPSSNFIRHVKNDAFFCNHTNFINQTSCSVTLAGLGAQSSKLLNTPKKLVRYGINKEQQNFFKTIAERAVTIGVRGEFTAECLELMGIHNVRIIGCPSFFMSFDGNFPDISRPVNQNVQMTFTPGTIDKTRLLEFGMKNNCIWVMQSKSEKPVFNTVNGHKKLSWKSKLKYFPGMSVSADELSSYSDKSKIFFDLNEWTEFLRKSDVKFTFGTRFHGNMLSLRNNIPALWIVHDSRTEELTKFLHLPNITMQQFRNIKYVDELLPLCDYTETKKYYPELCRNYAEFLEENHLNHKYHF